MYARSSKSSIPAANERRERLPARRRFLPLSSSFLALSLALANLLLRLLKMACTVTKSTTVRLLPLPIALLADLVLLVLVPQQSALSPTTAFTWPDNVLVRIFEHLYTSLCTSLGSTASDSRPTAAADVFGSFERVNRQWRQLAQPFFLRYVDAYSAPAALSRLRAGAPASSIRWLDLDARLSSGLPTRQVLGEWDGPSHVSADELYEHVWPELLERAMPHLERLSANFREWDGGGWRWQDHDGQEQRLGDVLIEALRKATRTQPSVLRQLDISLSVYAKLDNIVKLLEAASGVPTLHFSGGSYLWSKDDIDSATVPRLQLRHLNLTSVTCSFPYQFDNFLLPVLVLASKETLETLALDCFLPQICRNREGSSRPFVSLLPSPFAFPLPSPSRASSAWRT